MSPALSTNQRLFASALAQSSGLDPRTVETWMAAEEPLGANAGYGGTQDWLNVGITDSGPQGQSNPVWKDPTQAGQFTGRWLKGQAADPGFGTASPGIQAIAKTAGQSPAAQLAAIAGSGWASSGYGGAQKLLSLMGQITGGKTPDLGSTPNDPVATLAGSAPYKMQKVPTVQSSAPNIFSTLSSLEGARSKLMGQMPGSDAVQSGWDALAQLIQPQATGVTPVKAANSLRDGVTVGIGKGDVNPLEGWRVGRTDMGVDASASVGMPVRAPNNSVVVHIYPNWYQGQPYVLLRLTSGPNKGKYYYVAEQIDHLPQIGQYIPRNGAIARFAPSGTGIEMGWGTPGWQTQAQASGQTGDSSHGNSPAGVNFARTYGLS